MKSTTSIFISGLLLGLLYAYPTFLNAQNDCAPSQAAIDISGNKLKASLLNGGDMFWDFADAKFQPNYVDSNSPSSIFAAAIWMGGFDPAGNLSAKAQRYRIANSYWPGPLDEFGNSNTTNCTNWDRHFKVTSDEIQAFLADFQDDGLLQNTHTSILRWPAMGNIFFEPEYGFTLPTDIPLAPFMDTDADGVYNPTNGDFPVVQIHGQPPITNAAEIIFQMYNAASGQDEVTGQNIPMIIQQLSFTIACAEDAVLDNSLFSQFKLIHRGTANLTDFRFGIWTDFDLGCYQDDFVGSVPSTSTLYAYNADNMDDNCQGVFGFGENPPVQAMTFLKSGFSNQAMDVAMPMIVGNSLPQGAVANSSEEYYNFLSGKWGDGTPLTIGNLGYNPDSTNITTFAYSGDPTSSAPNWSLYNLGTSGYDIRMLGAVNLGTIQPGAINEINIAWTYHRAPGADHLGNVSAMKADVPRIKTAFENSFSNIQCSTVSTQKVTQIEGGILPNPASERIFWKNNADGNIEAVQIFDGAGRMVKRISNPQNEVRISDLPNGLYVVQLFSEKGVQIGKFVVQH